MWEKKLHKQWYALQVQTGQEEKVKALLNKRQPEQLSCVVPRRCLKERKQGIWKEVKRILFPGYVLIKCIMSEQLYYDLRNTEGLLRLLRDDEEPIDIPEEELIFLKEILANGKEELGFSNLYKEDDQIIVTDGPLKGMEGSIKKINKRKGRAQVEMTFMGQSRTIELGIHVITRDTMN